MDVVDCMDENGEQVGDDEADGASDGVGPLGKMMSHDAKKVKEEK